MRRIPVPVRALQVDRGSEFYAEFEEARVRHVLNLYLTLSSRVPECKMIAQMYDSTRNKECPCEKGRSRNARGRPPLSNPGAPGEKHFLQNKNPPTSDQAERPQKKLFLQNKRPAANVDTGWTSQVTSDPIFAVAVVIGTKIVIPCHRIRHSRGSGNPEGKGGTNHIRTHPTTRSHFHTLVCRQQPA